MREMGGGQKSCSEIGPSSFSAETDLIIRANCYRDDQSSKKFGWQLCLPPQSPSGYLGAGDILFGKPQQVLPCHLCSPSPSLLYSPILEHSEALNVATQDHNSCKRTSLFLVGLIVAGNRVYSWKELKHKHFIL